jgi:hypothetical protein
MRRVLTGYAVNFNRRHHRNGHLFQNRYKSILCQEDPYFLELVRYIHLNPLRAKLVTALKILDSYPYSGHSILMGRKRNDWQDTDTVLAYFGRKPSMARGQYRSFVEKGIELGKRSDLIGGGLIRSAGGWNAIKTLRKSGIHFKSDERILGDSDFVQSVLARQNEHLEERYRLRRLGYDFDRVVERVAELFEMKQNEILRPGKQPEKVRARSLVCYWAVKALGMNGTAVAQLLEMAQSSVSRAAQRGEKLAAERGWRVDK